MKVSVLCSLSWQGQAQAVGSGGSRNKAGALCFSTVGAGAVAVTVLSHAEKVGLLEGQP